MSQTDWVEEAHDGPYQVGQAVLLRYPQRSQKRLAPFEAGWWVSKVAAPSTVKIASGHRSKMVNVDLLKADPGATQDEEMAKPLLPAPCDSHEDGIPLFYGADNDVADADVPAAGRSLRTRDMIHCPLRYRE